MYFVSNAIEKMFQYVKSNRARKILFLSKTGNEILPREKSIKLNAEMRRLYLFTTLWHWQNGQAKAIVFDEDCYYLSYDYF